MCKVDIIDRQHPIAQSEPDLEWILYYLGGPALVPNADANVTILGNYNSGSQTAMLALEYYQGRVFLVGTHPESRRTVIVTECPLAVNSTIKVQIGI